MKKYCSYCGRIHDSKYVCDQNKRKQKKKEWKPFDGTTKKAKRLRSSNAWTRVSVSVRKRDQYLCQVCLRAGRLNNSGVQVHHIIPIEEDDSYAFDPTYLITLCQKHHEMAEAGRISRQALREIARSQEEKYENF